MIPRHGGTWSLPAYIKGYVDAYCSLDFSNITKNMHQMRIDNLLVQNQKIVSKWKKGKRLNVIIIVIEIYQENFENQ